MKRKLWILLFIAVVFTDITAQNVEPAQIRALYRYTKVTRHVDGHDFDNNDDMVLLASPVGSRFFSAGTEQYDSLMASPGGREKYKELLSFAAKNALIVENGSLTIDRSKVNLPSNGQRFQVTRADNSDMLDVVDYAAQEYFTYRVPLSDLMWEIGDSVKNVLGYECQMATADYHGRKWTAWFAADIPLQSGPWQLTGLPGLIMEAETEGGDYRFVIIGLESTSQPINPRPGRWDYTKTERKKFRKLQHDIQQHPEKAFPDGKVKIKNMHETVKARTAHDLIETDYK